MKSYANQANEAAKNEEKARELLKKLKELEISLTKKFTNVEAIGRGYLASSDFKKKLEDELNEHSELREIEAQQMKKARESSNKSPEQLRETIYNAKHDLSIKLLNSHIESQAEYKDLLKVYKAWSEIYKELLTLVNHYYKLDGGWPLEEYELTTLAKLENLPVDRRNPERGKSLNEDLSAALKFDREEKLEANFYNFSPINVFIRNISLRLKNYTDEVQRNDNKHRYKYDSGSLFSDPNIKATYKLALELQKTLNAFNVYNPKVPFSAVANETIDAVYALLAEDKLAKLRKLYFDNPADDRGTSQTFKTFIKEINATHEEMNKFKR